LLVAATVVLFLGVGAGTYLIVGRPALAVRSLESADKRDLNGLIALLVNRVHAAPDDLQSWVFLGKAYLSAGDGEDSAKALARAIALAEKAKQPDANLYSAYGEALTRATGTVPPEAQAAFARTLALN